MKCVAIIIFIGSISFGNLAQAPSKTPAGKSRPSSVRSDSNKAHITPSSTADDKAKWEQILAMEKPADRTLAVQKFLTAFPESKLRAQAIDLKVRWEVEEGNSRLQSGELEEATKRFVTAATEALTPVDEKLFAEVLSKLPAALFFSGGRPQGVRVAEILESKTQGRADQLLSLANFYLSIENGTKARELTEAALKIHPDSSAAYETLGLANRMDFRLDESATAYERALQLNPDSSSAKRGLAEMKRALGKPDEATQLFQEILAKEAGNIPARTGLVLTMFEAGKRNEAEAELAKSLNDNPGNVVLLAGAAHWYAAHDIGEKAVELAQKAIDLDPRFIWSHIALARGMLLLKKPYDAERTLIAARRYGNFPTLEFEIASMRLAAGFFRDAAEELARSFSITDGMVRTKLGGRIPRASKDFAELVGLERRASILSPVASSKPETDAKLFSLLEMKQALDSETPPNEALMRSVQQFVEGDDRMRLHRHLFAAGTLLDKNVALAFASDLAQAAIAHVDAGLESPFASSAVLASELYESRSLAGTRGEYLNVPEVPRSTLAAIIRGRIEEINGWAKLQLGDPQTAVIRLKRAVSVLPPDSAWWQSASWRLGSALAANGQDADALDVYIKTYKERKSADSFRYDTIAALYRKVHGNTDDLETLIGPNPGQSVTARAPASPENVEADRTIKEEGSVGKPVPIPSVLPVVPTATEPNPLPSATPEGPRTENVSLRIPTEKDPVRVSPETSKPTLDGLIANKKAQANISTDSKELFPPVVITIPAPHIKTKAAATAIPYLPNPSPRPAPIDILEPAEKGIKTDDRESPDPGKVNIEPPAAAGSNRDSAGIVPPCILSSSEDNVTITADSGGKAVVVGSDDDIDLAEIKALSSSPEYVSVRREPIVGLTTKALFVLKAETRRPGIYQVTFELNCGKKVIAVNIR